MTIEFDHVQYASGVRLMLGETSAEYKHTAPFTDREFYRSLIDPGFAGTISHLEGDLYFEGATTVVQNVTWKWQIRSKGQSTWTDLHTAVTEQWSGATDTGIRVGLDVASLGVNDDVPFEIRIIATASTAATVTVRIGDTNKIPAVRVIGVSL